MDNQNEQQPVAPALTPIPPQDANFIFQPQQPKKSNKGLIIVIIVLAVLLLSAAGVITYLLLQPKATTTTNNTTDTSVDTTDRAAELVAKVKAAVSDQLTATYPTLKLTDGVSAPAYKPADKAFAVAGSDFGVSLSADSNPSTYDQTGQTAIERAATEVLNGETDLKKVAKDWQTTYQNSDVVCTISTGSTPVYVSCGNIKDYAELVTQVEPFATAYLASEDGKKYGEGVSFGIPTVTQKSNGFRNASVGIGSTESPVGGFAGLFYAKDSNWTYWKGTQSLIPCTDYSTNDLQRAFENDPCYDLTTDEPATVKILVAS